MKIFIFKAGSKEWLECRKKYITGTMIATLFGINSYMKIDELIDIKFNGLVPEKVNDNVPMRAGRLLEPSHFIALNELNIPAEDAAPPGYVKCVIDDSGKLMVSMDGIVYSKTGGYPIECKSVGKAKWSKIHRPSEKRQYLIQLYLQMFCHNLEGGLLSILQRDDPKNINVYLLKRSKEIDNIILDTVNRFYRDKTKFKVNQEDRKTIIKFFEDTLEKIAYTEF